MESTQQGRTTGLLKTPGVLDGEIKDLLTFCLVRLTTLIAELVSTLPLIPSSFKMTQTMENKITKLFVL